MIKSTSPDEFGKQVKRAASTFGCGAALFIAAELRQVQIGEKVHRSKGIEIRKF
jgi:hypothetical protein